MNINMILRCLVQNSTEDAKLTQWNDVVSSVNLARDEMALLHILHDVVLQILTNTQQLRGQMDTILVSLASDYRYLFMALHILHDVVLQILTNTRQLRGQMDMILVSLASDYRYLFMYIMENGNQSKQ
ncbi:unnamed protein product [Rotaria sp. Silwood2]|nr:unnamed protein product [Rotaria sp. Silwood2]